MNNVENSLSQKFIPLINEHYGNGVILRQEMAVFHHLSQSKAVLCVSTPMALLTSYSYVFWYFLVHTSYVFFIKD